MSRQKYVSEENALSELGQKIFLDRYALKDGSKKSLAVGDEVLVLLTTQREIGTVKEIKDNNVKVELTDGTVVDVLLEQLDKPIETTVEAMMDRVAKGASSIEHESVREQYEKDFRWLLQGWKFVPGGRILSACGTNQELSYYNCFVIPSPEDSRGGIMKSLGYMAEIMSRGGGVGINLSTLRPHYAYVKGVNGRSSGSVSWGGLFSFVTGLIEQGGSRRGALMLILNVWHPDILEFINSKRTAGKITNANISVNISDDFMKAVEENADWELVFPDTTDPLYNAENWTGNLKAWKDLGGRVITHKIVPAREIWNKIIESAWASAEPGIWFGDRCARESNSWYYPEGQLYCTNPCVTGDTLILTDKGYVPIIETVGKEVTIWNGFEYSTVIPEKTGENQPIMRVTLSDGKTLRCTPYHKFILSDGSRVECQNLKIGDKLQKCHYPIIEGEETLKNAYTQGFFSGDGFDCSDRPAHYISLYGEQKKRLSQYLAILSQRESSEKRDTYRVEVAYSKDFVPSAKYTIKSRLEWLAGLVDSDGGNQPDHSITISSINKSFLDEVSLMLNTLGVNTTVNVMKPARVKEFLEGTSYECQTCYRITISQSDIVILNSVGFEPHRVSNKVSPQRNAKRFVQITSLENLEEREDVYCFTEPKNHSGIFNGILTAQCGEQPLPGWGVCNLGHINLSKMYANGDVDWKTLKKTVTLAVRFLDNVIDITPYFFEQNRKQQKLERRIGLGSIGLAELLIRAKIRYGSPECEAFINKLYKFIAVTAYEASVELGKEKGVFPNCFSDKLLKSDFMKRMPAELRDKIQKHGLRNITLLTQAPTGTVGTMVGTSTGIEPFYFWSYTRKSRLGSYLEKVSVLEEWETENPGKPLPDYFVNALDLTPEEHVRTQAAIQKWVDSAISKTCNVPTSYTVEQTKELYELMYKLGCKGGTIYRDKSRDEQVLNAEPKKVEEKPREIPKVRPRPEKRYGSTVTKETPAGTCHVIMNDDADGHPFEMFIEIGKGGSDIKAMAEALGRVASILLRISSPVSPEERIKEIIKQLKGIGGPRSIGFGKSRIKSLPDAVARALQENYIPEEAGQEEPQKNTELSKTPISDICPSCGNASFVNIEGCSKCYNCGHSEC